MRAFNLADLFELVADEAPDRLALVAGQQRLTFRQLDQRANRLGHHLASQGVQPGDKVGIYAWNRAEWMEAMLGAFKIRAVPININYRYVADELRYVLDNADVSALIVERSFLPLVAGMRGELPLLSHVVVLEDGGEVDGAAGSADCYEDALAAASPERGFGPRSGDDLYMLYTGGTTGMPKGVMWRAEDIFFAALGGGGFGQPPITAPEELAERIKPEASRTILMAVGPLMHGAAQWGCFNITYSGGTVVLYTGRGFDPHAVWQLVGRERCTSITIVGDAMGRPLAEALSTPGASYDTSSVLAVGSGGAVFSTAVKDQLQAHLPNLVVADSYGSSEVGAGGAGYDPKAGPRFQLTALMKVLDDDLRPIIPGSGQMGRVGRTGHIPLGYYKDEAKTAATFPTDPDGTRWAVPGDWATVEADGTVHLLGRGSQCINTGGEKVYPEEVEAALKSHPDVFDCMVVGLPDGRFGERVAAIVQPRTGAAPALEDLSSHVRTTIAGYKVPRQLQLVDLVQRTPSGKPDYRWAKQAFVEELGSSR